MASRYSSFPINISNIGEIQGKLPQAAEIVKTGKGYQRKAKYLSSIKPAVLFLESEIYN